MTKKPSFCAAALLAAAVFAPAGARAQGPQDPPRTGIQPAKGDRVYNTVLDLLRASGPVDGESIRGGELLVKELSKALPQNARLSPLECYLAGCWVEVQLEGSEEEIAKAAFTLNFDVAEDRRGPLSKWNGPKGRTALLLTDDQRVIEGWFTFVRSRAVSPATRDKQQIKLVKPSVR